MHMVAGSAAPRMPGDRDPHDGQPSNVPPDGNPGPDTAQRADPIRDDIAGIDPVRYGTLGMSAFGALAAAWLLHMFVVAGFSEPATVGGGGPVGMSLRRPNDLFFAVSNTYAFLIQLGPLLGLVLGLAVGRSVDARTPAAVAAAAAVTVGAAVTLFLLAIVYTLTYDGNGTVDMLNALKPALASTLGIAIACIGGASAIGAFESFEET